MAVEPPSNAAETQAPARAPMSDDEYVLTGDDVLSFLHTLHADRQRCHSLSSGAKLLREAVEAGLVDPADSEHFIAQMIELRDSGLADWASATHDREGRDLLYAAEFHLTQQGRDRLRAVGDDA